jgi:hypothetical protein
MHVDNLFKVVILESGFALSFEGIKVLVVIIDKQRLMALNSTMRAHESAISFPYI